MRKSARIFLSCFVLFVCLGSIGCSDPEAANNGEDQGQACDDDFDCPLPLVCGADGYCVEDDTVDQDTGTADTGTDDTGSNEDTGTSEDTGSQDTGSADTGTADTGTQDTGTVDTGTADTGTSDTGTDDTGTQDTGTSDTGSSDTSTADTGSADTGTSDTGTSDTGTSDTGTSDTGTTDTGTSDTGTTDTGTSDTGTTDTGDTSDTSDTGGSNFSGCRGDFDCEGYQSCNTAIGRCEDTRPSCSADSDCASNICLAGRCAPTCSATSPCDSGLDCFDVGLASGDGACLAYCGSDNSGNTYSCGADTQCMPYFGIGEGLCRGVGSNSPGDSCTDDFGADDCESGSYCLDDRGTKTCRTFCSASGSPGCASGDFCRILFPDDEDPTNSVGVCELDCGGIGSTDDTLCSGSELCQPNSSSNGYCTTQGTVAEDGTCYYDGSGYCEVGLTCSPAGTDAPTDPTEGRCKSLCDPSKTAAQNICGSSEACIAFSDDPGLGACRTKCDPSQLATNNACGSARPRCIPSDKANVNGYCTIAGPLSNGGTCDLAEPLNCSADDLCVIPNDATEPYGGGDTGNGTCTRYCESFQYASGATSRCGTAEVCASRYLTLRLGFCTTNKTSTRKSAGSSCTSSEVGSWCDDNVLCDDWDQTGNPRCEIPCDTSVSGTCPSGTTCQAILSSGTAGYCN